jgi:Tfp pilus assembly protein PilF
VIDNLETIDRDALRPLFVNIPRQSKIVITSRIGIGEIEVRYQVKPMSQNDSVNLLRKTAQLMNVNSLGQRPDKELTEICQKLFFSPLAIRWFVQSYAGGRSIQDLENSRTLDDLLSFCFQNLYDTLTNEQRKYLRTLVAIGKPLSEVQIALLSDEDDIEKIRSDLRYLSSSNLLRRLRDDWAKSQSELWSTTEFAQKFILTNDRNNLGDRMKLRSSYRKLIQARDNSKAEAATNLFNNRVIHARSTDESMVVNTLKEASAYSRSNNYEQALKLVDKARMLLPDFYEVWRVSAQIKEKQGDLYGARDDFDKAVMLADRNSEPLLVQYAQFLEKQDEFDHGIELLEDAASRPGAAPQLVAKLAWLKTRNREIPSALKLFENSHKKIEAFGGNERTLFLTQYIETLKGAADDSLNRQLPDDAFKYITHAFDILYQACTELLLDAQLIRVGQECFNRICTTLGLRCSISMWEQLEPRLSGLREHFNLVGQGNRYLYSLENNCPDIYNREDFQRIISRQTLNQSEEFTLLGTVRQIFYDRGYGFIMGNDGREYFLHVKNMNSIDWRDLCDADEPRVQFVAGPESGDGKLPDALKISLAKPSLGD